jgi:mannitol/fructose-specific phosphotransferase system IIA component (Ntr-type)
MRLIDFVVPEAIILALKATTKDGVIQEMVDSLAAAGILDPADVPRIVDYARRMEDEFFNGMHGNEVARLESHGRHIARPCIALGIARSPLLEFESYSGSLLDIVILQCLAPTGIKKHDARQNLDMQYLVERTLVNRDEGRVLREQLRKARSHEEVVALIAASPVEAPVWPEGQ